MTDKLREAIAEQISEGLGATLRKFCDSPEAKQARHYLHAMPKSDWNTLIGMLAEESAGAARAALAAAPQPENGDALSVLSGISSYLGAGMGDENTTPAEFDQRIRWGIDNHVSGIIASAADTVERLSKRPNTTWGEVKAAVAALAAAPQPAHETDWGPDVGKEVLPPYQPAPDREALVEVIRDAIRPGICDTIAERAADALLARGLRLPSGETMAWAVVGEDGEVIPGSIYPTRDEAERVCDYEGERVVRVAIRVVEGGDDA